MRALVVAIALILVAVIARAQPTTAPVSGAIQFGHKAHAQVACAKCHDPGKPRKGKTHARCIGCHLETRTDKTFPLSDCAKCHPAGNDRPHLQRSQIVVTSAFSHGKHAPRAKQCAACHGELTNDLAIASPRQPTCTTAGCHDGKAAFDAISKCTKCHVDVPKGEFSVARPDKTFSHAKHEPHVSGPCTTCHTLSKTGEIQVGGHTPCVTGCHKHEDEFGKREPTICGACHDGTEPWRKLIADKIPADATEFGSTLDHRNHNANCATCHSLTTTRTELRPPRGHRACTTCHLVTGGPAPQMAACESCHQAGVIAAREAARLTARWSVRATFNHREHASKVTVDCARCHTDLSSPTTLSLAAPPKSACASCHDGTSAFKVTGTSCTKCHPGAPK
jgi:c(7)-type cytochrome triheme protein